MTQRKQISFRRGKTFLREWRKFRKLSQEQAAEQLDIDRTTLSRIERGEVPYNQDLLEKAALAYGCDPEDLISINPTLPDTLKLVYSKLKRAPHDLQEKALEIIEVLLKAS